MQIVKVYQCLCDATRLRILNLLIEGPLCVCHLAEILEISQPKTSRHLKAMREAGTLETERYNNWTICRIPTQRNPVLETNLKCLQDLRNEQATPFKLDLKKRQAILKRIASDSTGASPETIKMCTGACC